ncbi:MAG: hypothetical protein ABR583_14850 [Gaiellaceae bacterium]
MDEGFSPELGARPLKRAVERHLLAPLAAAIVEQTVPEGDQFLLVGAPRGERIEVVFVDPDAEPAQEEEPSPETALDLRALVLAPRGDAARFVLGELERVAGAIRDDMDERKRAALAAMGQPGFWDDARRFAVLAEAEYLDRLDAALGTAERLGERLARSASRNGGDGGARDLVRLVANRVYVLDTAVTGVRRGAPADVFVELAPAGDRSEGAASFVDRLAEMYRRWADERGMRVEELAARAGRRVLAVSGLGAGEILMPESGLHVFDAPGERVREVTRAGVLVRVAARPPRPDGEPAALGTAANAALGSAPAEPVVVRRYQERPTPLVRDAVRGYRTGRLDRVLAGNFDLF